MKPVEPMSPEPMILGVADSDRTTVGFARRRMGLEIACMSDKWFMSIRYGMDDVISDPT
jgi:hypothetical protein